MIILAFPLPSIYDHSICMEVIILGGSCRREGPTISPTGMPHDPGWVIESSFRYGFYHTGDSGEPTITMTFSSRLPTPVLVGIYRIFAIALLNVCYGISFTSSCGGGVNLLLYISAPVHSFDRLYAFRGGAGRGQFQSVCRQSYLTRSRSQPLVTLNTTGDFILIINGHSDMHPMSKDRFSSNSINFISDSPLPSGSCRGIQAYQGQGRSD